MSTYRKPPHLCVTKFCRRKKAPKHGNICGRCSMHQWRAANPMKHRLAVLRHRARRKKVPFDLTMEWLTDFLTENAYDSSLHHIDRKIPWLGYTIGNLQILDGSENIAKGNRERYGQAQVPF